MGSLWVFGILDRERKLIIQDIDGYQVPSEIEELVRKTLLVGILEQT